MKIVTYVVMFLFLMGTVIAYGGGGGILYIAQPKDTTEGNTLRHQEYGGVTYYSFECNGYNHIWVNGTVKSVMQPCVDDFVKKIEVTYSERVRYGYVDIYYIPLINGAEILQGLDAVKLVKISVKSGYESMKAYFNIDGFDLYYKADSWVKVNGAEFPREGYYALVEKEVVPEIVPEEKPPSMMALIEQLQQKIKDLEAKMKLLEERVLEG